MGALLGIVCGLANVDGKKRAPFGGCGVVGGDDDSETFRLFWEGSIGVRDLGQPG